MFTAAAKSSTVTFFKPCNENSFSPSIKSLTGVITSPILSQMDLSLMDYLQRKISSDIFENHMYSDIRILEILEGLGVVFLVPHTVIIKSLYSVLSCLEQFKEDEELNMIQNLLVNGIIQQVVAE